MLSRLTAFCPLRDLLLELRWKCNFFFSTRVIRVHTRETSCRRKSSLFFFSCACVCLLTTLFFFLSSPCALCVPDLQASFLLNIFQTGRGKAVYEMLLILSDRWLCHSTIFTPHSSFDWRRVFGRYCNEISFFIYRCRPFFFFFFFFLSLFFF